MNKVLLKKFEIIEKLLNGWKEYSGSYNILSNNENKFFLLFSKIHTYKKINTFVTHKITYNFVIVILRNIKKKLSNSDLINKIVQV